MLGLTRTFNAMAHATSYLAAYPSISFLKLSALEGLLFTLGHKALPSGLLEEKHGRGKIIGWVGFNWKPLFDGT